jgi:phosphopantothenoylcysteine decarboxylase/phosphopantothenate--cysteine ligase
MNTRMWNHPTVRANISTLADRGVTVVRPGEGELACGDEGAGRLADLPEIVRSVREAFSPGDLDGVRIVVSAGPTREPIDPVRFISNRSTGRMGYALARRAAERGAKVALVSGPVELEVPANVSARGVVTAREMHEAIMASLPDADWLAMSAAVADFTPSVTHENKYKKSGKKVTSLDLVRTPDILQEASTFKENRLYIGFAAETEDVLSSASKKLSDKGLDMIVANDVSLEDSGFASEENQGTIIDSAGSKFPIPKMSKLEMADRILDHALKIWKKREG